MPVSHCLVVEANNCFEKAPVTVKVRKFPRKLVARELLNWKTGNGPKNTRTHMLQAVWPMDYHVA